MSAAELSALYSDLNYMTVDKLKMLIRKLNEGMHLRMRLSGVKQELTDRIKAELHACGGDRARFQAAKLIVENVRDGGASPASSSSSSYSYNPTPQYHNPHAGSSHLHTGYQNPYLPAQQQANYGGAAAYTAHHHQHLPPARFNNAPYLNGGGAGTSGLNGSLNTGELPIKFRTSPFYRPDKALSSTVMLVKAGQGDRKTQASQFVLTEHQRALINAAKTDPNAPQYQVRLYCACEDFFNYSRPAAQQLPAPVDFPQTCEIRVNGLNVAANTKGIKKLPGSAPPVDLSSKVQTGASALNKVEMIYANTDRKFYMIVYFVQVTSVKQAVEKIKKGKFKTKEEVIAFIKKINDDPDMVASALGVSLKDPLTFTRIKTPVRSSQCEHIACFDADIFMTVNEATPTWKCPHCSKVVKVEDLTVDGFFEDLLKVCPSSVESVSVEPDGTWRSDNDKYGTAPPKKPANSQVNSQVNSHTNTPVPPASPAPAVNGKGKGRATEELTLDSDSDEGDRPLKRPKYEERPSAISLTSSPDSSIIVARGQKKQSEMIDLTLSSDEEDNGPAVRASPAKKRRVVDSDGDDGAPDRTYHHSWM